MDDLQGAPYIQVGYLDPNGATYAYAVAAKNFGTDLVVRNRVLELKRQIDGKWDVITENGNIPAEHVFSAVSLWAKQCGRMAGVELPVKPMEHDYLATEGIPSLTGNKWELHNIVDLDGFTYARQEGIGLLLEVYERSLR